MKILDCGHIPSEHSEITTGYGKDEHGKTFCYSCCKDMDVKTMRETEKFIGYLVKRDNRYFVTNWPGSLEIQVKSYKTSWHNMAGKNGRIDFWFTFEGAQWHGYQIGQWNEIAYCKRTK